MTDIVESTPAEMHQEGETLKEKTIEPETCDDPAVDNRNEAETTGSKRKSDDVEETEEESAKKVKTDEQTDGEKTEESKTEETNGITTETSEETNGTSTGTSEETNGKSTETNGTTTDTTEETNGKLTEDIPEVEEVLKKPAVEEAEAPELAPEPVEASS